MKMANIGCGKLVHQDWINLDLFPSSPRVIQCDITSGLPFADDTLDACYSSHVLEHLTAEDGAKFLAEQLRVLKPGGVIRVVVPDLENICSNYLRQLEEAGRRDSPEVAFRHYYSVIEVIDQLSRHKSGGLMMGVWKTCSADAREYVVERNGLEVLEALDSDRAAGNTSSATARFSLREKAGNLLADAAFALLARLQKRNVRECTQVGKFRLSGEVHRFMYDRILLGRILRQSGFCEIRKMEASSSAIPSFPTYQLDAVKGVSRKPESLYMEARKQ